MKAINLFALTLIGTLVLGLPACLLFGAGASMGHANGKQCQGVLALSGAIVVLLVLSVSLRNDLRIQLLGINSFCAAGTLLKLNKILENGFYLKTFLHSGLVHQQI
jgi:hypothetical protein